MRRLVVDVKFASEDVRWVRAGCAQKQNEMLNDESERRTKERRKEGKTNVF